MCCLDDLDGDQTCWNWGAMPCENHKSCLEDGQKEASNAELIAVIVVCCCCTALVCSPFLLLGNTAVLVCCIFLFPVVLILATLGTGGLALPITLTLFVVWLIALCFCCCVVLPAIKRSCDKCRQWPTEMREQLNRMVSVDRGGNRPTIRLRCSIQ